MRQCSAVTQWLWLRSFQTVHYRNTLKIKFHFSHNFLQNSFQNYFKLLFVIFLQLRKNKSNFLTNFWRIFEVLWRTFWQIYVTNFFEFWLFWNLFFKKREVSKWKTVYFFLRWGNPHLWPCYSGAFQKMSFPVSTLHRL